MVAPITGPFSKFPTEAFADNYRQGYRQKMPIDRPLAYRMYRYYGQRKSTSWNQSGFISQTTIKDTGNSMSSIPGYAARNQHAYNQAYERLRASVSDRSGWAENIAQINKTRESIIQRSVQLANVAVALRKGRFDKVARILRTPKPSGVSNRKAAAQNFLEWEYGIKPLISDLETSMKILTSEPDVKWVRGSGRANHYLYSRTFTSKNYGGYQLDVTRREGYVGYTLRTGVRITNPNIYLANQLGLIDLALPWKLFPFSFIVDWFVNVEQVISSVSDWYGVSLIHPHYTVYKRGSHNIESSGLTVTQQSPVQLYTASNGSLRATQLEVDRVLGIPSPNLVIKPFKGFSLERAAQAVSLVLAVFGK